MFRLLLLCQSCSSSFVFHFRCIHCLFLGHIERCINTLNFCFFTLSSSYSNVYQHTDLLFFYSQLILWVVGVALLELSRAVTRKLLQSPMWWWGVMFAYHDDHKCSKLRLVFPWKWKWTVSSVLPCDDRSQIRNQLKRKAYEDAGLQPPATTATKVPMKAVSASSEPHSKKQKTSGNEFQLGVLTHALGMVSCLEHPPPPPHVDLLRVLQCKLNMVLVFLCVSLKSPLHSVSPLWLGFWFSVHRLHSSVQQCWARGFMPTVLLELCFVCCWWISLSVSVCLSFCLPLPLSVSLSLSPPLCLSVGLSLSLSFSPSLSVCLSLSFSPSLSLSLPLSSSPPLSPFPLPLSLSFPSPLSLRSSRGDNPVW